MPIKKRNGTSRCLTVNRNSQSLPNSPPRPESTLLILHRGVQCSSLSMNYSSIPSPTVGFPHFFHEFSASKATFILSCTNKNQYVYQKESKISKFLSKYDESVVKVTLRICTSHGWQTYIFIYALSEVIGHIIYLDSTVNQSQSTTGHNVQQSILP